MLKQVFISYSTGDTAVAEQIRDHLEAASIPCWMAPRDIAPGQDYAEQIIHAIEMCPVLVLLFSESSNRSQYVLKEVERAIAKRKLVIPFRIHNVQPSRSLEFFISNCQWVDASQSSLLAPLATLTAGIHNHLRSPAADAQETVRSVEAQAVDQGNAVLPANNPRTLESPRSAPPPFQVLTPPSHFVGRSAEIAQLQHGLTQPGAPIYALVGMGGAGKTTLATQVAHTVKEHFADGVLYANAATSDPLDILASWARAYGYDFGGLADVQSRAAAVRGLLAEKQVLIVLDNVLEASKVQPLLPSGARNPVLLTTRDLDVANALNAHALLLGELSAESSRQLLAQILGEERVQPEEEAAAQIGALLHYLPLAVEIVAQRLKSRPRQRLAQMAERLGDVAQRLGLEISDRAVRASFEVSWQALTGELQRCFALLAVFAGRPFTATALAAIAGANLDTTEDQLFALEALSLVKAEGESYFRQHPLLADFGREKLGDADVVLGRMTDYYFGFAQENKENYDTLEPEWGNINAAIQTVYRLGNWSLLVAFTDVLAQTWLTRARYGEARQMYALAQEAALKLADQPRQAANLLRWGEVCLEQSDYDQAKILLNNSLILYRQLEQDAGIASAQYHLARVAIEQNQYDEAAAGLADCLAIRQKIDDNAGIAAVLLEQARIHYDLDAFEQAKALAEHALTLQKQVGDQRRLLPTLRMLAQIELLTQQYERALSYCQEARALSEKLQDRGELVATLYTLTGIHNVQQNFDLARLIAEEGLALIQRLGMRKYEGMMLYQLGHIHRASGNLHQACECTLQSIEIFRMVTDELNRAFSLVLLGDLYADLDRVAESKAAWQAAESIGQTFNQPWLIVQAEKRLG